MLQQSHPNEFAAAVEDEVEPVTRRRPPEPAQKCRDELQSGGGGRRQPLSHVICNNEDNGRHLLSADRLKFEIRAV